MFSYLEASTPRMKQFSLILMAFICYLASVNAQKLEGQAILDSMLAELPTAKEDTNKVLLLTQIAFAYRLTDPNKGVDHGLKALTLSNKLNWKEGIVSASIALGITYYLIGDMVKAEQYLSEAISLAHDIGDKNRLSAAYTNRGNLALSQGDHSGALGYYMNALKIHQELKHDGVSTDLMNIGVVYYMLGKYDKALDYYDKALKLHLNAGNQHGVAGTYLNIGIIYVTHYEDYDKALEYYTKAQKIYKELGDKNGLMTVIGKIAAIHERTKNYELSATYLFAELEMAEEMGLKNDISYALYRIGYLYFDIAENGGFLKNRVSTLNEVPDADLPRVSIPQGRTDLLAAAEKYYTRALSIAIETGFLELIHRIYLQLSYAYEKQGDYKKSLEAHKKYLVYKDSIFNKKNTEKIAKLEVQAEYDKKQLADSIQNAEAQKLAAVKLQRQQTMTYSGAGVAVLLLVFSIFIFRNNKKLGIEKEKSETLLNNILPEEIASELKQRGATTAQQYDNVTVLFTDFVNFTTSGERMGSQALVEELHNCFKAFDELLDKYNIEKIKTIGDAYLAVCGLPTADGRHAEKVVKAAQEIRTFMQQRREQLGDKTFEIRIGIHSGSVVAGIVGVKKFAYDIWGDTVNTAARMEQNSKPGKINISESTHKLVQDKFNCTFRGEIEAKGKGMLKMYFVEGTSVSQQG